MGLNFDGPLGSNPGAQSLTYGIALKRIARLGVAWMGGVKGTARETAMNVSPQRITMWSGAVLIFIGILGILDFQVLSARIELVAIGALLEIVGYLGGAPWKRNEG
jgi:hypothetical protein